MLARGTNLILFAMMARSSGEKKESARNLPLLCWSFPISMAKILGNVWHCAKILLSTILAVVVWQPMMATFLPASCCFNISNQYYYCPLPTHVIVNYTNMMNLHYYREVDKLQDSQNFRNGLQTGLLVELLCQKGRAGNVKQMVLMNRLEAEMRYMYRKTAYVGLKCLIFVHQVIQRASSQQTIDNMLTLLNEMDSPLATEKIDQYLVGKLVNPYKQYLKKLACRKQFTLCQEQNSSEDIPISNVYWQYNFINYALAEFAAAIQEFKTYFQHEYPHLNSYIDLVGNDLAPLYDNVMRAFEDNVIGQVTFIQVEQMGSRMNIFSVEKKKNKKQLSATADNTNSAHQHRTQPQNYPQVTPFFNLQSSNLSLNLNLRP